MSDESVILINLLKVKPGKQDKPVTCLTRRGAVRRLSYSAQSILRAHLPCSLKPR
jgi:hypothetical protein